jgi:hypothetical protein
VECLQKLPTDRAKPRDISTLIYSLQAVRETDKGAAEILKLMTAMITESLDGSKDQIFSAQDVSMVLYGLRKMTADSLGKG